MISNEFVAKWKVCLSLLTSLVLSFFFLFFFSGYTSPLSPYCSGDTSVFYTMGFGMNEGCLPYKDLFDHKGPVLYFIYALGWWIAPGKGGLFFLQVINFGLWLFCIDKILSDFCSLRYRLCCLLLFCCFSLGCMGGGALTEEWCLLPSTIALMLGWESIRTYRDKCFVPCYIWMIWGGCLAITLLIRVNNACIVSAVLISWGLRLLYEGRFGSFAKAILFSVIGVSIITLPVVIWIMRNNIWSDFISSYFSFNISYCGSAYSNEPGMLRKFFGLPIWPLFLTYVLVGFQTIKTRKLSFSSVFVALIVITTHLSVLIGHNYDHYYILVIALFPVLAIYFKAVTSDLSLGRKTATLIPICILCSCIYYARTSLSPAKSYLGQDLYVLCERLNVNYLKNYEGSSRMVKALSEAFVHHENTNKDICTYKYANAIKPIIGENDILVYEDFPHLYLYLRVVPSHRFFFIQMFLEKSGLPDVKKQLVSYLGSTDAPQFVFLAPKVFESVSPEVRAILNKRYRIDDDVLQATRDSSCPMPYLCFRLITE